MNVAKSFLMGGASMMVAAMLWMVAAPKSVHAVVAALVQVSNTSANPVPALDTERNARIPYQSSSTVNCGTIPTLCIFSFTTTPVGYRLVIQNVNGYVRLATGGDMPVSFFQLVGSNVYVPLQIVQGTNIGLINQNFLSYADLATPIVTVSATFGTNFTSQMNVTGYLENCAVTGCPAIQH